MELVFATNNQNKLREIRNLIEPKHKILSIAQINCMDELPETSGTIEGNASQKAFYVFNKYMVNCFADDTGLEIKSLGGNPGVYSARYAGADCNPEDNMKKVLKELEGIKNRKAVFRCVLSLIINGEEKQFEGRMEGTILAEKRGTGGFGYDPIFMPNGFNISFAEMPMDQKSRISHRAVAVRKLTEFLLSLKK